MLITYVLSLHDIFKLLSLPDNSKRCQHPSLSCLTLVDEIIYEEVPQKKYSWHPRPWSSSRPDVVESVSEMKIVGMGTTQTPRSPSYKNRFLHSVRVFRARKLDATIASSSSANTLT